MPLVKRTVMHIDMNAFFASIEQRANPALRSRPVAVVGSGGRTVVTTASYEARARGVRTGMNRYEALKLCPELIVVIGDNSKYVDASVRMLKIFESFSPMVEVFSIDEAFIDVTESKALFGSAKEMARAIKGKISEDLGITCSVGIAPNKLLAKLASGMEKPDGLQIIRESDIESVLLDLPVRELCGIGSKLEAHLREMGIRNCGELARASVGLLRRRFGIVGERLASMARGEDPSPVVSVRSLADQDEEVKSIGHSTTFPSDIRSPVAIRRYILKLSEMVARRARRHSLRGSTVQITVRYADFYTFTRQRRLSVPTCDARVIAREARALSADKGGLTEPVRLVGVAISSLVRGARQRELFADSDRREELLKVMDRINDRFGSFSSGGAATWATLVSDDDGESNGTGGGKSGKSGVISPSWRPLGVKRVDVE